MSMSSDRSSDSNVRRVKIRLNLNKNFVIITCDNLIETQTFNHYDARSINSEIKMMTIDIHSINIACWINVKRYRNTRFFFLRCKYLFYNIYAKSNMRILKLLNCLQFLDKFVQIRCFLYGINILSSKKMKRFSFYLMMQFVIKFIFYRYNKNYPLLIQTI